ncbi:MAG: M24 family metallopeptidase, partial [Solirubrobacteraceae bacterium]
RPHAHAGERTIERGQTIVVDAGCSLDGYCSDCTRTFATAPLPRELEEAYSVCLQAQRQSLQEVRAGASGRDVDAIARELIEAGPYAGTFGHGLGHGVGLEVHEAPRLSKRSEDDLETGNVVTVEPGVYLPGSFGVRIEDLVVVTDDEPQILTSVPKDLRVVD